MAISATVALTGSTQTDGQSARSLSVSVILGIPLIYQHYDTNMPCLPCAFWGLPQGPHPWNDAKGPDLTYGTIDDCPHCSAYCAPASIAMIATYRGMGAPLTLQDNIYDSGKSTNGEILGNVIIESHGFGMFQGTGGWPPEVQTAMSLSVGPIAQYDSNPMNPAGPMTAALMQQYIAGWTPILWLDVKGFPTNQSPTNPPPAYRVDQGHAKVIVGYDDGGTVGALADDRCLINDPWPEYNDMGLLPVNCTQGPGGTWDPYWQPLNDVNLSDISDIYIVDTFPAIPEFSLVVVPTLGTIGIMAVAWRRSVSKKQPE